MVSGIYWDWALCDCHIFNPLPQLLFVAFTSKLRQELSLSLWFFTSHISERITGSTLFCYSHQLLSPSRKFLIAHTLMGFHWPNISLWLTKGGKQSLRSSQLAYKDLWLFISGDFFKYLVKKKKNHKLLLKGVICKMVPECQQNVVLMRQRCRGRLLQIWKVVKEG